MLEDFPGGPVRRRSCIYNKVDKESRLEIVYTYVDDKIVHPTIHKGLDCGSIGFPHAVWLYGKQRVRGTMASDHTHNLVRDQANATGAACFRLVKSGAVP